MPRIASKRQEYKIKDFTSKVKGKCAEKGIKQYQLANMLGMQPSNLTKKMQQNSYSLNDFLEITELLNFSDEELSKIVR